MQQENQTSGSTLKTVDKMIAQLGGTDLSKRGEGPCGLLLEHLRAARTALLGAMQSQYSLSLEQAVESIACIPSKLTRGEIKASLESLIELETARLTAAERGRFQSA
jgi:hypothetical protein